MHRLLFVVPLLWTAAFGQRFEPAPVELHFESYCDPASPGQSFAELQWVATPEQVAQQQLDVTVYNDGFQRGMFRTVQPSAGGRSFALPGPPRVVLQERKFIEPIPGLQNLTLVDVATSGGPPRTDLRLRARLLIPSSVVVRVQGLQSGIRYFWRVWPAVSDRPGMSFVGPICPVDQAPGPIRERAQ
jgi:hypothetical protein